MNVPMTTGYVGPGFAIKAVCFSLAAAVLVFVSMLLLTVLSGSQPS